MNKSNIRIYVDEHETQPNNKKPYARNVKTMEDFVKIGMNTIIYK